MKTALVLAAGLALAGAAGAARKPQPPRAIDATVVRVVDGDTLVVEPNPGETLTVRVEGIDAPEICQAHGPQAKAALEELALRQPVQLLPKGRDDHGRTLARVHKAGVDLGDRLVRDGHAWSHRYKSDRGPYVAEERMARALQRGLHGAPGAVMPRDFRKAHGACAPAV